MFHYLICKKNSVTFSVVFPKLYSPTVLWTFTYNPSIWLSILPPFPVPWGGYWYSTSFQLIKYFYLWIYTTYGNIASMQDHTFLSNPIYVLLPLFSFPSLMHHLWELFFLQNWGPQTESCGLAKTRDAQLSGEDFLSCYPNAWSFQWNCWGTEEQWKLWCTQTM